MAITACSAKVLSNSICASENPPTVTVRSRWRRLAHRPAKTVTAADEPCAETAATLFNAVMRVGHEVGNVHGVPGEDGAPDHGRVVHRTRESSLVGSTGRFREPRITAQMELPGFQQDDPGAIRLAEFLCPARDRIENRLGVAGRRRHRLQHIERRRLLRGPLGICAPAVRQFPPQFRDSVPVRRIRPRTALLMAVPAAAACRGSVTVNSV